MSNIRMRVYTSDRKEKGYKVKYNGRWIHFGSDVGSTYIDHNNDQLKRAWIARHSKLSTFDDPNTPSYWSRWLLWNKKTLRESLQALPF